MSMQAYRTLSTALVSALAMALVGPGRAAENFRTRIAPGVELVQTLVGATEPGGPAMVHALVVDPRADGIRLAAALGGDTVEEQPGNGMEAVNRQVARTGALAGLNADFFPFTGDPLGLAIQKGEVVSEPLSGRGAIGFRADGSIVIGRPTWSGSLTAEDGSETRLAGLNRKPGAGELVLFGPVYGETTPDKAATLVTLDASGAALSLKAPLTTTVVSLQEAEGKVAIPKDRLMLSGTGAAAEWLRVHALPGKTLTVRVRFAENGKDWSTVTEAVAGGPVLLTNAKPDLQLDVEKMGQDFSSTRHPRSAVGVTKDGKVLLVAVDGRQILSRGMSLPELTEQMVKLGAVDALNLDGGGSTALSVRGLVINSPSDGQVRRVANSLLVFAPGQDPIPEPAQGTTPEPLLTVTSGGPLATLPARPDNSGREWVYGTRNGGAFVDQQGRLYGYRTGDAEALAQRLDRNVTRSWSVRVAPGPANKMLTAWKDGTLEVTVRDVNNNGLKGQKVRLSQADGTATEMTTDDKGVARIPAGWLKDEKSFALITSGSLSREWGEKPPVTVEARAPAKPAAAPKAGK